MSVIAEPGDKNRGGWDDRAELLGGDLDDLVRDAQRDHEAAVRGGGPHHLRQRTWVAIVVIGAVLIGAQLGLMWYLQSAPIPEGAAVRVGPPERFRNEETCAAIAYRAYRGIVEYMRANQKPPPSLASLIGVSLERTPVDPKTGLALVYETDGERFKLRCP